MTILVGSLVALFTLIVAPQTQTSVRQYDVVIYGGTAAAVTAAVQVTKMGKSVIIVSPDKHLGGLSSGGLGFTGHRRQGRHRRPLARVLSVGVISTTARPPDGSGRSARYGNKGQGTPAIDGEHRTMWIFEPHVAEQVFEERVKDPRSLRSIAINGSIARQARASSENRRSHRVDHDAERTHLHRQDVHRRHL